TAGAPEGGRGSDRVMAAWSVGRINILNSPAPPHQRYPSASAVPEGSTTSIGPRLDTTLVTGSNRHTSAAVLSTLYSSVWNSAPSKTNCSAKPSEPRHTC